MLSLLPLGLVILASIARAQMDPECIPVSPTPITALPTTASFCTLFFTPYMPPQFGPTSTVYATMMTTQLNVVNCNYCQVSNIALNPVPTGPFTTKVTSDYLLVTQIACMPSSSALGPRHALADTTPEPTALIIRGAKPSTLTPVVKRNTMPLPRPLDLVRRQALTNTTLSPPMLTGEAYRLLRQLHTVIYAFGVINSGADLGEACLQLQSANAILDLPEVGLNATQASAIVCSASLPDFDISAFNQTLIASAAAALYGIQVAANFTGTVDSVEHCNQLDLSPLPAFGVDTNAIQSFICNANNATSTSADNGSTLTANVTSAGTLTPFPFTNSSVGTITFTGSVTVTGPVGSAGTAPWGTGLSPSATGFYPTNNVTAISGSTASGTAVVSTGELPAGTGFGTGSLSTATIIVENGTAVVGTGNLPTVTVTVGNSTAVVGTGSLPATTVDAGNGTAAVGTGIIPTDTAASGTGVYVPGVNSTGIFSTGVSATGNLPASTGLVGSGTGVSATGDASAGYSTSSADSWSTQGGYGYYGQDIPGHVPRGPTTTPRYYPKYF